MKRLFIQQKILKITDHYPIRDESDNIVYQVDQDFQWLGYTVHVSRPDGTHVFTIRRELFRLLPRFVIEFADGRELVLQSKFTFFYKRIEVEPQSENIRIEGSFWDKNFDILKDNKPIGHIEKKLFAMSDKFVIEVLDEEHQDLFVAMMIAVDAIIDAQQNS